MSKPFKVAIIGGGIAGITLAIALHHRNIPVTIYEQAREFGEVGAGVSFSPNAVQAMKACHHGVYEAYENVCTRNLWESKQNVWFDYLDGYTAHVSGQQDIAFTIRNGMGQSGVHRAHFLDEMVKLIPLEIARFHKHLVDVTERSRDGKLVMHFSDGATDEADLVIGCDGIKSRVRELLVGEGYPAAMPLFIYKYAYQGLVLIDKAVEAIREELALNFYIYICFPSPVF